VSALKSVLSDAMFTSGASADELTDAVSAFLDSESKDASGIEYALLASMASGHLYVVNFEVGEE